MLRQLNCDLTTYTYATWDRTVFQKGWNTPRLRTVSVNMSPAVDMGEGVNPKALLEGFGSSVTEYTPMMDQVINPWFNKKDLVIRPNLKTLAFHLVKGDIWSQDLPSSTKEAPLTGVTTLIFVQRASTAPEAGTRTSNRLMGERLVKFLSRSTLPSLERVYYLTEDVNGHVWHEWSQIAVDLVKAGVDVVYL